MLLLQVEFEEASTGFWEEDQALSDTEQGPLCVESKQEDDGGAGLFGKEGHLASGLLDVLKLLLWNLLSLQGAQTDDSIPRSSQISECLATHCLSLEKRCCI